MVKLGVWSMGVANYDHPRGAKLNKLYVSVHV